MQPRNDETKKKMSRKSLRKSFAIIFAGIFVMILAIFLERSLYFLVICAGIEITIAGGLSLFFIGGLGDRSHRRRYIIGSILVLGGPIPGLYLMNVYLIQIPLEQRTLPFFFSFGLILGSLFIGAIMFLSGAPRSRRARLAPPPNILEAFKHIEPEETFEAKNCTVVKKGDVYAIIPKVFNAIYFLRFMTATRTPDTKMRLPMRLRWSNFQDEIGGFPVAKLEGEFSIPVSATKTEEKTIEEKCARGKATLLVMARREKVRIPLYYTPDSALMKDLSTKFNENTAINIMDKLSRMPRPRAL
jgi:hypothetical protein